MFERTCVALVLCVNKEPMCACLGREKHKALYRNQRLQKKAVAAETSGKKVPGPATSATLKRELPQCLRGANDFHQEIKLLMTLLVIIQH